MGVQTETGLVAAASLESAVLMVTVVVLLVAALVGLALVSSALGGVYAAAVYRYAAEGAVGTFFSAEMVRGAFRQK